MAISDWTEGSCSYFWKSYDSVTKYESEEVKLTLSISWWDKDCKTHNNNRQKASDEHTDTDLTSLSCKSSF